MAAQPPLTCVVLAAASVADDLGYVALSDLASVLGASTCRIIGGHMVTALVARWQLGAELYRETGDTDLGVPPGWQRSWANSGCQIRPPTSASRGSEP